MPNIFGHQFGDPDTPPQPAFDLAGAVKGAPSDPQAKKAYWESVLTGYVGSQGGVGVNDKGQVDPNISFLQKMVADSQGDATGSTTAGHDATTEASTIAHNLNTEQQARDTLANTSAHDKAIEQQAAKDAAQRQDYENKQLGISAITAQIRAQGIALRAKAEQDTANARGDANKIRKAQLDYEMGKAELDNKLAVLKDQVTSFGQIMNNETTESVNQADSRNADALKMTAAAAGQVAAPDMIKYGAWAGNPTGAAGAMAGLMQAGSAYSNANGGAPVDVQNLALQHKMQIADLVLNKGFSFADAHSVVTGGGQTPGAAPDGQGPPPSYGPTNSPVPMGFTPGAAGNASASGVMGSQGFQPGMGIRNPDGTIRSDVMI